MIDNKAVDSNGLTTLDGKVNHDLWNPAEAIKITNMMICRVVTIVNYQNPFLHKNYFTG
jgi:hypothetical protein